MFGKTRETGLEPATSGVTGRCSNQLNYSRNQINGRNRTRTYDRLCVRQELYQLSYTPLKRIKFNCFTDFCTREKCEKSAISAKKGRKGTKGT